MDTIIALRYFVIKERTLFGSEEINPVKLSKNNVLIQAILNSKQFSKHRSDFVFRLAKSNENDCFVILGHKIKTVIGNLNETDIEKKEVDNWQDIYLYINFEKQLILVQHKEGVIALQRLCKLFSEFEEGIQKQEGYSIKVEPIIDEVKFWQIIKESDGLFEIYFELNAPNLFGASKKANEFQQEVKKVYNQDKLIIGLENKNAKLQYDEEAIESFRDYADSGGGNWLIKVLNNTTKTIVKSYQHAKSKKVEKAESIDEFMKLEKVLQDFIKQIVENDKK